MKKFRDVTISLLMLASSFALSAQERVLKLGVTAGPYADISHFAAELADKQGLKVKVIEFLDYNMPNAALQAGDIDFNNSQSPKFLKAQVESRGYDFVSLAPTIIVPIGLYSKKYAKLDELPQGALIGLPNDPANLARSLVFLEKRGLIGLRKDSQDMASPRDVERNPKKFKFIELDHGQLPRSLEDTSASVITLNYAMSAGLDPKKALTLEDYANDFNTVMFVTTKSKKDDPAIQKFVSIYRSKEVKDFVQKRFNGYVPTAW